MILCSDPPLVDLSPKDDSCCLQMLGGLQRLHRGNQVTDQSATRVKALIRSVLYIISGCPGAKMAERVWYLLEDVLMDEAATNVDLPSIAEGRQATCTFTRCEPFNCGRSYHEVVPKPIRRHKGKQHVQLATSVTPSSKLLDLSFHPNDTLEHSICMIQERGSIW
jgi:hypothetical protein